MEGLMELPVQVRSFQGPVVENSRLENWAIMAENRDQVNHGLLPAGQTLKMSLTVSHDWAPPEPEPEPEAAEGEEGA